MVSSLKGAFDKCVRNMVKKAKILKWTEVDIADDSNVAGIMTSPLN